MALSEIVTCIIGLMTLIIGDIIVTRSTFLSRLNIPAAVIGGLLTSIVVSLIEINTGTAVNFASGLRDVLILIFFVSLGLTARVRALLTGGKPLFYICAVTVLLLCVQNFIGLGVALAWGAPPFYGLLAGSISFVGGPGTALAWAKEATATGLEGAELVAVSAATFAVSIGALISGPVTSWIVERHNLRSAVKDSVRLATGGTAIVPDAPASVPLLIRTMLLIAVSIWLGELLNSYAKSHNLLLPGFLCALLAGMLFANLADLRGMKLPLAVTDRIGDIALQIFLAISLMSLKISAIGVLITPLMIVVVFQVVASIAIAYLILFRLLGRDYDAAVAVGGFLGFAVSSMPVAMATMDKVTERYGPSPKAVLLITLAGSFFVDLANAFLVKGFVALIS